MDQVNRVPGKRPKHSLAQVAYQEASRIPLLSSARFKAQLQLSDKFYEVIQKHSGREVSFAAVIGPRGAGKSLLVDKLLEHKLSSCGSVFTKLGATQGCWMTQHPVEDNGQSCCFLIDSEGLEEATEQQEKMLAFLYSSCSVLFLSCWDQQAQTQARQLKQKLRKFRASFDVPSNLSDPVLVLVRRDAEASKVRETSKSQLFSAEYDLGLASPGYKPARVQEYPHIELKALNSAFKQGVQQIGTLLTRHAVPRTLNGVTLNANIAGVVFSCFVQQLNKGKGFSTSQAWQRVHKQLYVDAYNYSLLSYTQFLQSELADEKGIRPNELKEKLDSASLLAMTQYNAFGVTEEGRPYYLKFKEKLTALIKQKQQQLIKLNLAKQQKGNLEEVQQLAQLIQCSENLAELKSGLEKLILCSSEDQVLHREKIAPLFSELARIKQPAVLKEQGFDQKAVQKQVTQLERKLAEQEEKKRVSSIKQKELIVAKQKIASLQKQLVQLPSHPRPPNLEAEKQNKAKAEQLRNKIEQAKSQTKTLNSKIAEIQARLNKKGCC